MTNIAGPALRALRAYIPSIARTFAQVAGDKIGATFGAFVQGQVKTIQDGLKEYFTALTPGGRFIKTFTDASKLNTSLISSNRSVADALLGVGRNLREGLQGGVLENLAEYTQNFQGGMREFSLPVAQLQERMRLTNQDSTATRKTLLEFNYNSLKNTKALDVLATTNLQLAASYGVSNDQLIEAIGEMSRGTKDAATIFDKVPEAATLAMTLKAKTGGTASKEDLSNIIDFLIGPEQFAKRAQLGYADLPRRILSETDSEKQATIAIDAIKKMQSTYSFVDKTLEQAGDTVYGAIQAEALTGESYAAVKRYLGALNGITKSSMSIEQSLQEAMKTQEGRLEGSIRQLYPNIESFVTNFSEYSDLITGYITDFAELFDPLNFLAMATGDTEPYSLAEEAKSYNDKQQDILSQINIKRKQEQNLLNQIRLGYVTPQTVIGPMGIPIPLTSSKIPLPFMGKSIYPAPFSQRATPEEKEVQQRELKKLQQEMQGLEYERRNAEKTEQYYKAFEKRSQESYNTIGKPLTQLIETIDKNQKREDTIIEVQRNLTNRIGSLVALIEDKNTLPNRPRNENGGRVQSQPV